MLFMPTFDQRWYPEFNPCKTIAANISKEFIDKLNCSTQNDRKFIPDSGTQLLQLMPTPTTACLI
jgi:hypothetical protein